MEQRVEYLEKKMDQQTDVLIRTVSILNILMKEKRFPDEKEFQQLLAKSYEERLVKGGTRPEEVSKSSDSNGNSNARLLNAESGGNVVASNQGPESIDAGTLAKTSG